jgi:hypothetical protein
MSVDHERLLTAAEVAQRLGFSERYVWKLGREGALPRVKLPGNDRPPLRVVAANSEQEPEPRSATGTRRF